MILTLISLISPATSLTEKSQHKVTVHDSVHRINYGIIFRSAGMVQLSQEHWIQTFQIPIPQPIHVGDLSFCNNTSPLCVLSNSILAQIHGSQLTTAAHINKTLDFIRSLIPYHKITASRARRSLLPFIGTLSKGLFGTATMHDVEVLASHINALTTQSRRMAIALQQHGSHVSSYMRVVDRRMDILKSGITNNFRALNQLSSSLTTTILNLETTLTNVTQFLVSQVDQATQIRSRFDDLRSAALSLSQGKLTPTFLPRNVLSKTIHHLNSILTSKYPGIYLAQHDVNWYYMQGTFLARRNKGSIYISVRFPVTSHKHPFNLLRIINFPVPVNSSSQHATKLIDTPKYLAVANNQQYYVTLDTNEVTSCKGDNILQCEFNKALIPVTTPSCILGIFMNNKKMVKDFCEFRFLKDYLQSNIIELSHSSVLVYNVFNIDLSCPGEQKILPGCHFCIINLPCKCSMKTKDLQFSHRLIDCHNKRTNFTEVHPVNLALLQEFFNTSTLKSVFGDTTYLDEVNVKIPGFQMYQHNFNQFLVDDSKAHLNVTKMAQAAKNDSLIFQSLSEPLLHGSISLENDWPDFNAILIFVTMSIAVLSFLACIWSFFKIRKLIAMVTVLQQVSSVKSEAPSFIYELHPKVKDSDTSINSQLLTDFSWNHASVIISSLVMCTLLCIVLFQWYKSQGRKCTKIMIEITSGGECVLIPVIQLPLCPSFWHIVPPSEIFDVRVVSSYFHHELVLQWPNFKITNVTNTRSINVQTSFKLSLLQKYYVGKILRQPYDIHILLVHHDMYTTLPSVSSTATQELLS